MDLTVTVVFPHRRYHGTPWDQAANSGLVEWPPSPWRLARALLSVWHTRHPDLDRAAVERIVHVFGGPAVYGVPATGFGHTRHYMPLLDHKSANPGGTTLTLDAYAAVNPTDELVISWRGVDLSEADVDVARLLWESLPYLGRAESVCRARLLVGIGAPTGQAWVPDADGDDRLMCIRPDASMEQLEVTPTSMRKARLLMPPAAEWIRYQHGEPPIRRDSTSAIDPTIHAARWRLVSAAPFPEALGLWATDRLRYLAVKRIRDREDPAAVALHGHFPQADASGPTLHRHAHWLWTAVDAGGDAGASSGGARYVQDLVVWVPDGVPSSLLASMVGKRLTPPDWAPRGFVDADLALVGFGGGEIIRDLGWGASSPRWTSATPYLMTRHMKPKRDFQALLIEDVERELRYRLGDDAPQVVALTVHGDRRAEAMALRQQRIGKGGAAGRRKAVSSGIGQAGFRQREAMFLSIELDGEVVGPLVLGGLSHFGFGRFATSP